MLCQNCHNKVANVHFTQVINTDKVEMHLCEQCAKEKGQFSFGNPLNIDDFFSGIIGFNGGIRYVTPVPQVESCDKCGMSFEEFQKIGKLGCDNCYELFGERLQPIIKRLHGDAEHTGKMPAKVSKSLKESQEIEKLKELLNTAIQNEEYEKAAELRDKIKSMEVGK